MTASDLKDPSLQWSEWKFQQQQYFQVEYDNNNDDNNNPYKHDNNRTVLPVALEIIQNRVRVVIGNVKISGILEQNTSKQIHFTNKTSYDLLSTVKSNWNSKMLFSKV